MSAPLFADHAAIALEAQYAVFGVLALWTPAVGGAPIPCTVIKMAPDVEERIGRSRVRAGSCTISVRASEVATPLQGDLVAIVAGATFRILADPMADDFGLEWPCEAAPAP